MKKIDFNTAKTIGALVSVVLILAILVIAGNKVAKALGLGKDEEEKQKEENQKKIVNFTTQEINNLKKKGIKPSYSDGQYLKSAEIIQKATQYSALDDKNAIAIKELIYYTPKDIDFLKLTEAFGSKTHAWFGIDQEARTLPQLLTAELSKSEKEKINNTWAKRKMNSRIS